MRAARRRVSGETGGRGLEGMRRKGRFGASRRDVVRDVRLARTGARCVTRRRRWIGARARPLDARVRSIWHHFGRVTTEAVSSTLRMMRAGEKTEPSSPRAGRRTPRESKRGVLPPRRASAPWSPSRRPRSDGVGEPARPRGAAPSASALDEVRDVVAEIADVGQRVVRAPRRLLPPPLRLGEGHAREKVLLDLRARLHARELALGERARGPARRPELLGASPSSCASSCHEEEARDAAKKGTRGESGSAESSRAGDGRRATTERSFPRGENRRKMSIS